MEHVVSRVTPGGRADGKLLVGDVIVSADGVDVLGRKHDDVVDILSDPLLLRIVVRRHIDGVCHSPPVSHRAVCPAARV